MPILLVFNSFHDFNDQGIWVCEFLTDKFSIIAEIPALNIDPHLPILEWEPRSMLSAFFYAYEKLVGY